MLGKTTLSLSLLGYHRISHPLLQVKHWIALKER